MMLARALIFAAMLASPVDATEFVNPTDADMRRPHICGFVRCWYTDPHVAQPVVKPPQLPVLQPPGAVLQPRPDAFMPTR
jgi:hypothetical protein